MKRINKYHLLHKVQTKLVFTYSIIVLVVFFCVFSIVSVTLSNQMKKDLLRTDKEALIQIGNSIVLMTDFMVEKMISIYSEDDVGWFFDETTEMEIDAFKKWSVSSYEIASKLKKVKNTLRSNAMLYTLMGGSNVLVSQNGVLFTFWSSDYLSDYSANIADERNGWDTYFEKTSLTYKWEIISDRKAMSFQQVPGESTLSCIYSYRPGMDRKIKGYICMNIDAKELKRCYATYLDQEMGNAIYIVDRKGDFLSLDKANHLPFSDEMLQTILKRANIEKENKMGNKTFFIQDKDFLYNCVDIPSREWLLINRIPVKNISLNHSYAVRVILITFLIGAVCAIGLVLFFTNRFSYRIHYLKELMKHASSEQYAQHYDIRYFDELDEIGESFNVMVLDIKHYTEKLLLEEKQKKMNEIHYLHAQINTHFLYNIFNSIKMLSLLKRNEDINEVVTSLSKLLRGTLDVSDEMITMEEELQNVYHYFQIEKIIHLDTVLWEVDCPQNLMDKMIPKLLLQPIVENSFLHGFSGINTVKKIKIIVTLEAENKIKIMVVDNGNGMTKQKLSYITDYTKGHTTKIGLKNIEERIHLLFGFSFGMEIESIVKKGTSVSITFPFIEKHTIGGNI